MNQTKIKLKCSKKKRYKSKKHAEEYKRKSEEHGSPTLTVYECPYCEGWHLSSKEKK